MSPPTTSTSTPCCGWRTGCATIRGTLLLVSHDREFLDGVVGAHPASRGRPAARLRRQLQRLRAAARGARPSAAAPSPPSSARGRAHRGLRRALPRQGEQGAPGAEPPEVARAAAARSPPCTTESRLRVGVRRPRQAAAAAPDARAAGAPATAGGRVLEGVSLRLHPGDRIGILGRNGAGKSTLMRVLAGELEPAAGDTARARRTSPPGLLRADASSSSSTRLPRRCGSSCSAAGRRSGPGAQQAAARPPRDASASAASGCSSRPRTSPAASARVWRWRSWSRAARTCCCSMSRPTTWTSRCGTRLLVALQEFPGAVVLVSHDRALLRGACDRFVLVADGALTGFDGDLEDYAALARRHRTQRHARRGDRGALAARGAAPRGRGARQGSARCAASSGASRSASPRSRASASRSRARSPIPPPTRRASARAAGARAAPRRAHGARSALSRSAGSRS